MQTQAYTHIQTTKQTNKQSTIAEKGTQNDIQIHKHTFAYNDLNTTAQA